ncbi:hypothetical protein RI054_11g55670 [Pseudoscourfieldia marina]
MVSKFLETEPEHFVLRQQLVNHYKQGCCEEDWRRRNGLGCHETPSLAAWGARTYGVHNTQRAESFHAAIKKSFARATMVRWRTSRQALQFELWVQTTGAGTRR